MELFGKFDYDANYCFRARAREWNNRSPGEGYVSELWSAWACATTSPIPEPPPRPSAPTLKYFPPVPERHLDAKVEIDGKYPAMFNCKRLDDTWAELEHSYGNGWGRIDQSGISSRISEVSHRTDCPDRGWPAIHHLGGGDGKYATVSPGDPDFYRVCVANDGGRTCSSATRVRAKTN